VGNIGSSFEPDYKKNLSQINGISSWKTVYQVTPKGKNEFVLSGRDGFFLSPDIDCPSALLPYLRVRMKVTPKNKKAYSGYFVTRLYWKTEKSDYFSDRDFVELWLSPRDQFTTYDYYFINPENLLNNDRITGFKLLPAYFPSIVEIESLKLMICNGE
jgi:hypothetical protein